MCTHISQLIYNFPIVSNNKTVMVAGNWLNANIKCCLMVSYVLSNMLFYLKTRPYVPPNFHYPLWNDDNLLHTFMRHYISFPPWAWCQRKMAAVWIQPIVPSYSRSRCHPCPPPVSTSALPLSEHSSPHTNKASIVHFNHPHLKFAHPICYQITWLWCHYKCGCRATAAVRGSRWKGQPRVNNSPRRCEYWLLTHSLLNCGKWQIDTKSMLLCCCDKNHRKARPILEFLKIRVLQVCG